MEGNFEFVIHTASYSCNQVNFYRSQAHVGGEWLSIPNTDWTYRVTFINRIPKPDEYIFLSDGKHYNWPMNHSLLSPPSWYGGVARPWAIHHPSRVQTLFLDNHIESADLPVYQELFSFDTVFVADPWATW